MKMLSTIFALLFVSVVALATSGPIEPWITKVTGDVTVNSAGTAAIASGVVTSDDILDDSIASADILDGTLVEADFAAYDTDTQLVKRVARVTYDFAEHGGATSTIDLGVDLPAAALVERVDAYVVTQIVDGGAGTIALECEDSANLEAATDHSGVSAGSMLTMDVDGAIANFVGAIAAQCNISIVIGGAAISAGKVIFFVHYLEID